MDGGGRAASGTAAESNAGAIAEMRRSDAKRPGRRYIRKPEQYQRLLIKARIRKCSGLFVVVRVIFVSVIELQRTCEN